MLCLLSSSLLLSSIRVYKIKSKLCLVKFKSHYHGSNAVVKCGDVHLASLSLCRFQKNIRLRWCLGPSYKTTSSPLLHCFGDVCPQKLLLSMQPAISCSVSQRAHILFRHQVAWQGPKFTPRDMPIAAGCLNGCLKIVFWMCCCLEQDGQMSELLWIGGLLYCSGALFWDFRFTPKILSL